MLVELINERMSFMYGNLNMGEEPKFLPDKKY